MTKTSKKPITCPVCKKRFHKGKTDAFGRMSKHLWREHPDYMKRKIKKGQRAKRKSSESELLDELQFTDDMILQSLGNAGIPIGYPQQPPMLNPYSPTQHQSIAGSLITAYKLGMQAYTVYKGGKALVKQVKKGKKR